MITTPPSLAYTTLQRLEEEKEGRKKERSNHLKQDQGGTGKLKCFICHSKDHLKRDCPMKKSSGFVRKGKHDQDSDSSDDKGNAYFGEALVVVENDEMAELVIDSGLRRSLISLGTLEKEGYNVKMQMGRIKGAQGDREVEVFQVSNDDTAVAQRRLEDKQLEEKTNTDCLGNIAKKKKVKESMKANLGKLLKYNAWSTRWSSVRGSSMRKRC
ncbi:zinc finger, CCHC-type containing protein [Tanacetum coccineum]|uniref:Zinc finger, CCHC-type containing protein n=1 Tax=Tanacetum coccineum TaxID=301880 RepID=A0ABQ5FTT0_9ASTR